MITAQQIHEMVLSNRDEILECLVEVLQTPSPTGHEQAVSKVFCKWIERIGLTPTVLGPEPEHPNVFAEWFGSQPGKRFIFNGHMDHFPPPIGVEDTYGPYSGMITDGCVYGRGASDMKSGDVSALMAVGLLKRMGFDPKGSILLSYMCDEEDGGKNGVKWAVKLNLLNGDFGICPEATKGKLIVRQGGVFRAAFTYTSEGASSWRNHPTKSALEKSMIAINALYKLSDEIRTRANELGETPSLSITSLHAGGKATNLHANESTFTIDRRMVIGHSFEDALTEILGVLDALEEKDPLMAYTWEETCVVSPLNVPEDSYICKVAGEAYKEVTGRDIEFMSGPWVCDACTIQAYNGILMPNWSGATYGMGCKKDERVNIHDMLEAIEYFMLTLVKIFA